MAALNLPPLDWNDPSLGGAPGDPVVAFRNSDDRDHVVIQAKGKSTVLTLEQAERLQCRLVYLLRPQTDG